jgi:CMP-N,N'-diacetyllegionaminic acid synthase
MTNICTICARGGSRGVPGKNIRLLEGKPLIAHTIEMALANPGLDRVVVSTDSQEIAEIAAAAGAEIPYLRPAELATDQAGKLPAIVHVVEHVEATQGVRFDRVIDLDPTSPLRMQADINACMALLDAGAPAVITAFEAEKNPYFNMVEIDDEGGVKLSKQALSGAILSRQAAPKVYSMNASIYGWQRANLGPSLWPLKPRLHVMPRERSIDIDSELDFQLVELLMQMGSRNE